MNYLELCEKILHQPSKIVQRFSHKPQHLPYFCEFEEGGQFIKQMLSDDKPCMICRFGSGELAAVVAHLNSKDNIFRKFIHLMNGDPFYWDTQTRRGMYRNAGFFPPENKLLDRFAQLMLNDVEQADILGAWRAQEIRIQDHLANVKAVPLPTLEPYLHQNPWSEVLKGRKVLVVHPFAKSIAAQYAKHDLLFKDQRVLPDFELKTIQAVQSIAGNNVGFKDWFAALDHMCEQISATDFDVAIIGAGAYGLPMAAHVKRIGKQSVHLGGATQILFGIKGRRWDESETFRNLYNEHWIRPSEEETPKNSDKVEGSTYW